MSILKELQKDIKEIVKNAGYEEEVLALETSNRKDLGEYQLNDAMQLARTYKQNPRVIAENIVKELEKDSRFTNINIAGPGFINITLSEQYKIDILNKVNEDVFNNVDKKEKKKVIIDFGGANVSKALHVGHLRSANLGESLKRLSRLLGYEVLGDAHLGDYGRPLGLVLLEIKKMYPELPYFDENYTGNYEEITLPITNKDLERIYPLASAKSKEDEKYLEEAREITVKIQHHERGYYDLWKKVVEISKKDIKEVYDSLNVEYDLWLGESDAVEHFDELNEIFTKKNLLTDSEGAKIVVVEEETDKAPMPPLLFIKSNESISYETTDLATILQRKKDYNPDEIWYCVDGRQELHFEQVFRAARKAKLVDDNVKLEFIGFGTMNGKDGKPFKTRDGGVMTLKNLINIVKEETYKRINSEAIKEAEKESIAMTLAIAALKYADFLPFRSTDYVFEVEKFADLEGKTGPYLLYSTIRMKSLLNKVKEENIVANKVKLLNSDTENEIALTILNLPVALNKSLETKSLNEIAEYIYKLTSQYNKFYAENKVLTEKNKDLQESWIVITQTVYNINMLLLDILGINVPEKM
jgi:arginyl-tRNA synthetase